MWNTRFKSVFACFMLLAQPALNLQTQNQLEQEEKCKKGVRHPMVVVRVPFLFRFCCLSSFFRFFIFHPLMGEIDLNTPGSSEIKSNRPRGERQWRKKKTWAKTRKDKKRPKSLWVFMFVPVFFRCCCFPFFCFWGILTSRPTGKETELRTEKPPAVLKGV